MIAVVEFLICKGSYKSLCCQFGSLSVSLFFDCYFEVWKVRDLLDVCHFFLELSFFSCYATWSWSWWSLPQNIILSCVFNWNEWVVLPLSRIFTNTNIRSLLDIIIITWYGEYLERSGIFIFSSFSTSCTFCVIVDNAHLIELLSETHFLPPFLSHVGKRRISPWSTIPLWAPAYPCFSKSSQNCFIFAFHVNSWMMGV